MCKPNPNGTIFNGTRQYIAYVGDVLIHGQSVTAIEGMEQNPDISNVPSLYVVLRGELSYLAPLGSENISAPYFKQCFFQDGITPQTVKHHASQSQDRNNKYFILYIEFCINNNI